MPQQRGIVIEVRARTRRRSCRRSPACESEIRDALINLVFNAVDAMPRGRHAHASHRATTRRRADAQVVLVEVVDTGIGMDEDTRRRCLEPFFTTKGERGTGLGLAMVYGVAQRHGAELEIESEPGKGTTVRLSFRSPRDAEAARRIGRRQSRRVAPCAS